MLKDNISLGLYTLAEQLRFRAICVLSLNVSPHRIKIEGKIQTSVACIQMNWWIFSLLFLSHFQWCYLSIKRKTNSICQIYALIELNWQWRTVHGASMYTMYDLMNCAYTNITQTSKRCTVYVVYSHIAHASGIERWKLTRIESTM